jgi:hypothetical protein
MDFRKKTNQDSGHGHSNGYFSSKITAKLAQEKLKIQVNQFD